MRKKKRRRRRGRRRKMVRGWLGYWQDETKSEKPPPLTPNVQASQRKCKHLLQKKEKKLRGHFYSSLSFARKMSWHFFFSWGACWDGGGAVRLVGVRGSGVVGGRSRSPTRVRQQPKQPRRLGVSPDPPRPIFHFFFFQKPSRKPKRYRTLPSSNVPKANAQASGRFLILFDVAHRR